MMFRFENETYLLFLLLVPMLGWLAYYFQKGKMKTFSKWKNEEVFRKIVVGYSNSFSKTKLYVLLIAFTLMILALCNPQFGSKAQQLKRSTTDIYLVIDISKSMDAIDVSPTRLIRSKKYLVDFIEKNKGNNFGLILFAGSAYLQMPLTNDYAATIMMVNAVNTSYAGSQGTNIESVFLLLKVLNEKSLNKNTTVLVVTDGEDHESSGLSIEKEMASEGTIFYCIAAGTETGGYIPEENDYKKDNEGNPILSKVNVEFINEIAKVGNGKAFQVEDEKSIEVISDDIEKMMKSESTTKRITDYQSYFQWLLSIALILLLIEYLSPKLNFSKK